MTHQHFTLALGLSLAACLGTLGATWQAEDEEPPMEFELEIGGRQLAVELDEPFVVEIGGEKVSMTLSARPTRLLQLEALRFRYPSGHAFSHEREGNISTIWTLDGSDNVLMLFRYPIGLEDGLLEGIAEGVASSFRGARTELGTCSMALAGEERNGSLVEIEMAGTRLVFQLYDFPLSEHVYILGIQDTLKDDGGLSEESEKVRDLLEETFELL